MSLNLHNLVADALTIVNDWQNLVFTKTLTVWEVSKRVPTKTTSRLVARGKLQPASAQDLHELGFDITAYEYFRLYMTGDPTQLDQIRQFGSDTFTCNGYTYKIVGKMPWDDAGWREAYCYRMKYDAPITPPENETPAENVQQPTESGPENVQEPTTEGNDDTD